MCSLLMTKLKEYKEDIQFWYNHNIEFPIKSFFKGISNLWKWKSVIWKDRDFDYVYLLIILKFKIDNMIDLYDYRDRYIGQEKHREKLKRCSILLHRLINNEYQENIMKPHDKKWGKIKFDWEKCDNENYKLLVDRDNVLTEQDEEKERKEFMKLMKHVNYLENQDIDYLFHLMKKHLRSWWI